MRKLQQLARSHRQAEANYSHAFRNYFTNHVEPLADDRFWQLQQVFRDDVSRFRFSYGRSNGVEQAAREFFRKPLAGDFSGVAFTMEEAIQFARSWRTFRERLYRPLFDVIADRGDDAYGDLLDALPLAGREVVERSLGREFGNQRQLEEAVAVGCGDQKLAELVLRGENYVGMSLVDAATHYFAISDGT